MTEHTDMLALASCPFCGGAAERVDIPTVGSDPDLGGDPNAGGSYISCKRCAASTALHFDRKENLYSSWNTRSTTGTAVDREAIKVAREAFKKCRPVERIVCQDFGVQQDDILDQQLEAAMTALSLLRTIAPAPVAKGEPVAWRLVPIEPDEKMRREGESAASFGIGKPHDDEAIRRVWQWMVRAAPAAPTADLDRLRDALDGIRQYGADTLSGRADGGIDDRQWQREAVREMTRRARTALAAEQKEAGK